MAYGTLPNIANAGHEPTPGERAEQIARNLLKVPYSHFTVIDGTCGEGNLLAPFADNVHAELIGIEINGKWAELAAERLPQAQIITAAIEHVSISPNTISLAVLNPPYLVTNGGRMEMQMFRQICDAVQPHGVIACIIPARSAWDRRFIHCLGASLLRRARLEVSQYWQCRRQDWLRALQPNCRRGLQASAATR